ncbi:MAG: hypothetical protein ABJA98_26970 [Acidobacteriota bacterium]
MITENTPTVMRVAQTWLLVHEAPLVGKEFGQLKCLRDKCGLDTLRLIEWVLHDWPGFTERVKWQTGFESVPPLPHVGFLLKFYLIALAMMAEAYPERVAHTLGKLAAEETGASTGV